MVRSTVGQAARSARSVQKPIGDPVSVENLETSVSNDALKLTQTLGAPPLRRSALPNGSQVHLLFSLYIPEGRGSG